MRYYRFVDWATQGFLGLVALIIIALHRGGPAFWPLVVCGHLAAMAGVHALACAEGRGRGGVVVGWLRQFYPILLYTFFYRETEFVNLLTGIARLDPGFVRLEYRIFGLEPSVALMPAAPWHWLSELMYAAYFSYYLMVGGLGAWLLWRRPEVFRHFVAVVSFVFYTCYLTYMFVPVVGPRLLFRDTPERVLYTELSGGIAPGPLPESVAGGPFFEVMAFIYRNFEAGSAAFPSSHVAVALTTLWFSWRYLPSIRWAHAVTAALLCVSTVYCRYHYAVDVPAGVLTALLLVPLGNALYRRFDGDCVPPARLRMDRRSAAVCRRHPEIHRP